MTTSEKLAEANKKVAMLDVLVDALRQECDLRQGELQRLTDDAQTNHAAWQKAHQDRIGLEETVKQQRKLIAVLTEVSAIGLGLRNA